MLYLSMAKNPSIRQTRMEGPSGPREGVRRHKRCSRSGRIGRRLREGVLIEMSAVLSRDWTWKEFRNRQAGG